MLNSKAPNDAYTKVIVFPGKKIETIPKSIKIITATNNTPPITVKSHFVWNANKVKPKQTAAVIPTASITFLKISQHFRLLLQCNKSKKEYLISLET